MDKPGNVHSRQCFPFGDSFMVKIIKPGRTVILTLERPTIKYSIVDQAGLAGPLSIFTHKLTYLLNISKWILLRMLYDHY